MVMGDNMQKAMLNHVVIDLEKLTKPEIMKLNGHRDFICLMCKKPVIFKNGTRKRAHFAHEKEGLSTSNPESAAHLLVKHAMAKWLRTQKIEVQVERRFTTIDRIADIYFEYQNVKYAMEIQKSPMSDAEFNQRVLDYNSVDVAILWIFLGEVVQKGALIKLPSVMLGRGERRLFHFCVKTARLRIFEQPVFVSTREVYGKVLCRRLSGFQMTDLLGYSKGVNHFDESWLAVKERFRKHGWFYASKSEKKLLEQCLIRGFNLSLLPTEIGWPVTGSAMGKHLFVWQAYILLTMMKHFKIGDVFSAKRLAQLLNVEYQLVMRKGMDKQIIAYLKWLVTFGVVRGRGRYFEYIKVPVIQGSMEASLDQDEKFVQIVAKLWKV